MAQLQIEGFNDGKPFSIERINLDAVEEVKKLAGLPKDSMEAIRGIVFAALLSSDSLDYNAPDHRDKLEKFKTRVKMEDAMKIMEAFMEVNKDFFSKTQTTRPSASTPTLPTPSTSSASPAAIPSNTPAASSSTTPSNSSKPA